MAEMLEWLHFWLAQQRKTGLALEIPQQLIIFGGGSFTRSADRFAFHSFQYSLTALR